MKNREAFEVSDELIDHTVVFRQSLEAHTILERLRRTVTDADYAIQYLSNNVTRGFLLDFGVMPIAKNNVLALMEIFKNNCQANGYVLYMSDSYQKGNEHFIRHYLKPSRKFLKNLPIDQLFGNVTIEFSFNESGKPAQLKVTTTSYPGRNYSSNQSLTEFLQMITQN